MTYTIGYTPYDGVPREEIVTLALPVTVILSILNICGIAYAVICLLFNVIFRKKRLLTQLSNTWTVIKYFFIHRLVRLDSPKINYLIISGAIMVYTGGIAFVIPTLIPSNVSALCIVC